RNLQDEFRLPHCFAPPARAGYRSGGRFFWSAIKGSPKSGLAVIPSPGRGLIAGQLGDESVFHLAANFGRAASFPARVLTRLVFVAVENLECLHNGRPAPRYPVPKRLARVRLVLRIAIGDGRQALCR